MPAPENNNYAAKPTSHKASADRAPAFFTPPEKKRVSKEYHEIVTKAKRNQ